MTAAGILRKNMIRRKNLLFGVVFLLISTGLVVAFQDRLGRFLPIGSEIEEGVQVADRQAAVEVVAEGLVIPWEVAFLPDGDLLVTERPGTIKRIGQDRKTYPIEGVNHIGEGGLLGMALHPNFAQNQWLYLYLTTGADTGLTNRVERYSYNKDRLSNRKVILANIPGAANHDGGRIAFGPDGHLYITTGDASMEPLVQDKNSLAGKILRLTDQGQIPGDNPFGNAIYSYGHRNPQGLAWDKDGRLWATEHGPSGIGSGFDELNLIRAGANYGWPIIKGDERRPGMEQPVAHSGSKDTWAPAGIAYYRGSLFFSGLRGESIYEAKIKDDDSVSLKAHYRGDFGRIRAAIIGPNNFLYITTSNTDGRGTPKPGDDKIIRINLETVFF